MKNKVENSFLNKNSCLLAILGVSKMALPMPKTKNGDHLYRPNYPLNLGKITFGTHFDHSKVVFWRFYIFCIFWPHFKV